jgi:heme exporter protein A
MTAVATPASAAADPTSRVTAVAVRDLAKTIDDRPVLCGIDVSIGAGEYVGILGANGAGKSTLLKLLATLMAPSGGEIALFGAPARKDAAALRRRIGLIDHQSLLYRDLTSIENLTFFAGLYGLSEPRRRAEAALDHFDLRARAGDPVKAFSRGMVQRLSIARALLHDPDLLLADEPFTGLDAPSVALLERMFDGFVAGGKTLVMVNHDVPQTLRIARRVIVLRDGRIALDRPTDETGVAEVLARVSGT